MLFRSSHDVELRDYVWGSMRCYECRSLMIVGMCSGHVHAYPNPPGDTLKGLRHLERASYMNDNEEDRFGGCPN